MSNKDNIRDDTYTIEDNEGSINNVNDVSNNNNTNVGRSSYNSNGSGSNPSSVPSSSTTTTSSTNYNNNTRFSSQLQQQQQQGTQNLSMTASTNNNGTTPSTIISGLTNDTTTTTTTTTTTFPSSTQLNYNPSISPLASISVREYLKLTMDHANYNHNNNPNNNTSNNDSNNINNNDNSTSNIDEENNYMIINEEHDEVNINSNDSSSSNHISSITNNNNNNSNSNSTPESITTTAASMNVPSSTQLQYNASISPMNTISVREYMKMTMDNANLNNIVEVNEEEEEEHDDDNDENDNRDDQVEVDSSNNNNNNIAYHRLHHNSNNSRFRHPIVATLPPSSSQQQISEGSDNFSINTNAAISIGSAATPSSSSSLTSSNTGSQSNENHTTTSSSASSSNRPPGAYSVAPGNVVTPLTSSKASLIALNRLNNNDAILSSSFTYRNSINNRTNNNRNSMNESENTFLSSIDVASPRHSIHNTSHIDDNDTLTYDQYDDYNDDDNDTTTSNTNNVVNQEMYNPSTDVGSSVPVAHPVPIHEEVEREEATMTIIGTPFIENEHDTTDNNNNNYNNHMDEYDKNLIWYKYILKTMYKNKIICTLFTIVIMIFITAGVVGTICGTTDICFKGSSNNNNGIGTNTVNTPNITRPLDDRAIQMMEYINNITLSNLTIGYPILNENDATIPEELALRWMIETDPLQLVVNNDTSVLLRIRQRYALRTLFFATSSSDNFWKNSSGWLNDNDIVVDDECKWFGVYCTSIPRSNTSTSSNIISTSMNVDNVVTQLDLNNNNLHGSIVPDLGLLSNLREIHLSSNLIYGTLPESIGKWTSIQHFDVAWRITNFSPLKLNGTVPYTIGEWTNLRSINLDGHSFTGTLPQSILNWNASIQSIIIGENKFTGTIPASIVVMQNLTILRVNINRFTGTIPESIGNLHLLEEINLYYNLLTGSLPSSIEYLSNMRLFDVSTNNLTGTIPSGIENWSNLRSATFSYNNFVGSIPAGICTMNSSKVYVSGVNSLQVNCSCCNAPF